MEQEIKRIILSCGADVCGIADIGRFTAAPTGFSPLDIYPDCKSVIAFGIALPKGLMNVEPRLIYGHYNSFLKNLVDNVALQGAKLIERQFDATVVPMPCDSPYEYWETDTMTGRGLVSMRHMAVQCGLGELGKNRLLLNPKYGTLLTVGAIFTDLALQSDALCGDICIKGCTKCIDACPVHAIEGTDVNQLLCRGNTYGKNARGFDTVNCNRCRTVCPRKYGC